MANIFSAYNVYKRIGFTRNKYVIQAVVAVVLNGALHR